MPPVRKGPSSGVQRLCQQQLNCANLRQKRRRHVLSELNALTEEVGLAAAPLIVQRSDGDAVESRVRLL